MPSARAVDRESAPVPFCPSHSSIRKAPLPASWSGAIEREIVESEYRMTSKKPAPSSANGPEWQAPNRAQGSYVKSFPISQIKIDRMFVKEIATDLLDVAITSAIISPAHGLHVEVIAEGVSSRPSDGKDAG